MNTIIFDWGNVLAPDSNRLAAKKFSIKYNLDEEKLNYEIDSREAKYSEGDDAIQYYEGINGDFNIPVEELLSVLNDVPSCAEMIQIAEELKKKGYTVAILSNQMKPKTDWIRENCNIDFFDGIYFSNEMRIMKPKKEAFLFVLEKLCKTPEECLFVDDYEENTTVASQIGMNVHLFRDIQEFKKELNRLNL